MSKYGGANAEKSPYFSVLHHFEEYNAELIFSNANLQNLISFKRFQAGKHAVDAEVEKTEKGLHHNDYSTCKPWPSHVKTFEENAYNPGKKRGLKKPPLMVEHTGLTRIAARSAVLRAAWPCSDTNGPLDRLALSGSSPVCTIDDNTKGRRCRPFALWWSIRGSKSFAP